MYVTKFLSMYVFLKIHYFLYLGFSGSAISESVIKAGGTDDGASLLEDNVSVSALTNCVLENSDDTARRASIDDGNKETNAVSSSLVEMMEDHQ
jgi:hypothetical protein